MTVWAFDADVLIYAATWGAPCGPRIARLLEREAVTRVGSLLLLPETLSKPLLADADPAEAVSLRELLSRIELRAVDEEVAQLATRFGTAYRLRAADAVHLATAVLADADAFLTNNRKDFPKSIAEIAIVYPDDLRDPDSPDDPGIPVTGSR